MATLKTCFKCGATKPIDAFYRHSGMADGRLGKCKECAKSDVRMNRRARHEYHKEYDISRAKRPSRIAAACSNTNRRRRETGYVSAHSAVARAVRDGSLVREPCQFCGATEHIHAHHDDYSKKLDVMWLCAEHHKARHSFLENANA